MIPYRTSRINTPKTGSRPSRPKPVRPLPDGIPDSGLVVREICNPVSDFSLRPTYREVTACGGTFPDTVTYLRGSYTPIGPGSSAASAAQALHLPESGTIFSVLPNSRGGFEIARIPGSRPSSVLQSLTESRLTPASGSLPDFGRSPPPFSPPPRGLQDYQLAFVTPGINPLEAISRN